MFERRTVFGVRVPAEKYEEAGSKTHKNQPQYISRPNISQMVKRIINPQQRQLAFEWKTSIAAKKKLCKLPVSTAFENWTPPGRKNTRTPVHFQKVMGGTGSGWIASWSCLLLLGHSVQALALALARARALAHGHGVTVEWPSIEYQPLCGTLFPNRHPLINRILLKPASQPESSYDDLHCSGSKPVSNPSSSRDPVFISGLAKSGCSSQARRQTSLVEACG